MDRHNAALKVLFFEMLKDLKLADSVWPWYSWVEPKPFYELEDAQAYWDVPVYAEYTLAFLESFFFFCTNEDLTRYPLLSVQFLESNMGYAWRPLWLIF